MRGDAAVPARTLIVKAAAIEFAARGYEAASLRAIARRAGVDAALVHHYFAAKADLFAETVAAPIRPDRAVAVILRGPRDEFGTRIVRFILEELDHPEARTRVVTLLRTAVGTGPGSRLFKQFLVREVFLRLAQAVDGDDADLRAALAASQIAGMLMARFVLELEPLASASVDELVARIGPVVQWHLTGYGAPPDPG